MGQAVVAGCLCEKLDAPEKVEKVVSLRCGATADQDLVESSRGLYTRVLALDFDGALTVENVDDVKQGDAALEVFGGQERVEIIQKFLTTVRQHGSLVIIVSKNDTDVILSCIEAIGLETMIDRIFDRQALEVRLLAGKPSKALLMHEILAQLGVGSSHAILVDACVGEKGKGMPCARYIVKGGSGITLDDMRDICQSLRIPFTVTELSSDDYMPSHAFGPLVHGREDTMDSGIVLKPLGHDAIAPALRQ